MFKLSVIVNRRAGRRFAAAPWLGHSIVSWKTNIINPDSLKPETLKSNGAIKPAPACDSQILLPLSVCKLELAEPHAAKPPPSYNNLKLAKSLPSHPNCTLRITTKEIPTVRSGLTTQAQRPGSRDAMIATATPCRVRCSAWLGHVILLFV